MLLYSILAFLLSTSNGENLPYVNVTGYISDRKIKIFCETMTEPIDVEFIVQGKSYCRISMSIEECDECICTFLPRYKVIIESAKNLHNDSVYGCEMVFDDGKGGTKVYGSVSYNGESFNSNKNEITGVGNEQKEDTNRVDDTVLGEEKNQNDIALIAGLVVSSIGAVTVGVVICIIVKKKRGSSAGNEPNYKFRKPIDQVTLDTCTNKQLISS